MSQIAPITHEAECWLYYGPSEAGDSEMTDYDGLQPYWTLSNLLINEFDGHHDTDTEINGERVTIQFNYSLSGFTPRPSDGVDGDRLYELEINVSGRGERKCDYNISPRYPNMLNSDGEPTTTAFDHTDSDEGMAIHCQPSNLALNEVPEMLARAVFELADDAGIRMYHGYFDAPFDGRVTALERYVRITRTMYEKLIGTGGVLDRLSMLLTDQEGTSGHYRFDNEDIKGHHHAIRHGSVGARNLVRHHSLGGQIKSYLPRNPGNFDPTDSLYHPKVGTKFIQKRNATGSVDWADRHQIIRELDERLLSLLSWADIPVEAGGTTYVADDHFDAAPADDCVPLHEDPTPRLEAEQEHLLLTCLRDMTPADETIVETLATDGGRDVHELADDTDTSLSTIYRALQRLDGVIESDNGHVRFVSEKLRSEVRSIVESVENAIESAVDRTAELVDMDVRQSASSAFDRWLKKYGAEIEWPEDDSQPRIRIDALLAELNSFDNPHPDDVIAEMYAAWEKDGRNPKVIDDAWIDAETRLDGNIRFTATPP